MPTRRCALAAPVAAFTSRQPSGYRCRLVRCFIQQFLKATLNTKCLQNFLYCGLRIPANEGGSRDLMRCQKLLDFELTEGTRTFVRITLAMHQEPVPYLQNRRP